MQGCRDTATTATGVFVFFAPRDNPEIAGVVFLEHGMHGPNAAVVAHHILDTFFAKKDGRPMPSLPADMRLDFKDPLLKPGELANIER